jgi:hypothetical protein
MEKRAIATSNRCLNWFIFKKIPDMLWLFIFKKTTIESPCSKLSMLFISVIFISASKSCKRGSLLNARIKPIKYSIFIYKTSSFQNLLLLYRLAVIELKQEMYCAKYFVVCQINLCRYYWPFSKNAKTRKIRNVAKQAISDCRILSLCW